MTNTGSQLTQFAARAAVVAALTKEMQRCAARASALAFLLVELDAYDARVGSEGEETAELVFGQLLRAVKVHCGRDHDKVFRISAECIAAVCPETFPAGAQHVAARVREAAEQLPADKKHRTPTVSIGLAVTAPDGGDDAEALLARAERCLQAAREKGGNTVVGAAPGAAAPTPPSLKSLFRKATRRTESTRRQGD